jgi:hypothetical protein
VKRGPAERYGRLIHMKICICEACEMGWTKSLEVRTKMAKVLRTKYQRGER